MNSRKSLNIWIFIIWLFLIIWQFLMIDNISIRLLIKACEKIIFSANSMVFFSSHWLLLSLPEQKKELPFNFGQKQKIYSRWKNLKNLLTIWRLEFELRLYTQIDKKFSTNKFPSKNFQVNTKNISWYVEISFNIFCNLLVYWIERDLELAQLEPSTWLGLEWAKTYEIAKIVYIRGRCSGSLKAPSL